MANNSTDTRIVQMQFDNREFERNIAQSEKSLDKFKEALDFSKCESSLEDFQDATKKLTFEQMAENIQKLTDKFTGLGNLGEFAISKVRHELESAAYKAKAFFDSMTIEQVNVGFSKFGQLNKKVQTIMAATGRAESDVYTVLERLNEYTDQTSYNFVDMAANIGKFTSVGIGLEDAEKQMEGIANWAARSGGGIQEASRAMYNLSQAMGVGALTKIDWKSIENASMATKEFKEQLIQAGLATGQLVKENGKVMTAKSLGKQVEVTYQNLAETLSKKWANTEVMQKSFMAYYYEDLYYTGEIATGVKTTKEQRDELRKLVALNEKIDLKAWENIKSESDKIRNDLLSSEEIDHSEWEKLNIDSEENRQKILDAAVEQKKILKEVNEEGYTVYKTLAKDGKQIELTTENFDEFVKRGLLDETLMTVVFGLDMDPLIESTEEQKQALKDALGSDDIILKKDWAENLKAAGLANDEFKQAAMDAAVAAGTLKKETDKAGKTIYKTAKGFGKETVVNLQNFEETLKNKWFTGAVADRAVKLNDLGKAAYESAQKCMTFTDVLDAWKDQLSTGWMNSYKKIFGELSESMELFSNVCNKVGEALGNLVEFRNKILDTWGKAGGRENLWALIVGEVTDEGEAIAYKGAYGLLDALGDIGEMISNAFFEMLKLFADPGSQLNWDEEGYKEGWMAATLNHAIVSIRAFIASIHDFFNASSEGSEKSRWEQIQDVVNAIFATFALAYVVIRDVTGFMSRLFDKDHLGKSLDYILQLLSALGVGVYDMVDSAESADGLQKLFNGLLESLEPLIAAVNELVGVIVNNLIGTLENGKESGTFAGIWETICDIFKLLGTIISKVAPPFLKFVSSMLEIINDLFNGELTGDKLKSLGARLEASITQLFDDVFGLIPGFGKDLQGAIAYIFGFAEEGAEDGADGSSKTILGVAKQWLRKIFGGFADIYDNIKGDADQFNLFTWAKQMLGLDAFGRFIGQMAGVVKGTNLYGIIMSFLGGYALFKLIGTLRQGTGLLRNLQGFFQGAQDVMKDGLKLKFGDQLESTGDKVMKIATGVALIAGSVAVLGSMDPKNLLIGFAALAGVMIALGGFLLLMKQYVLKDFKEAIGLTATIGAVAIAILSITLGIGLLVMMLKPLANMKPEGIIKMLTGLLGVVTILGLVAKYIGKDLKNLKGAGSIAAMAVSIGLLIFALKPLATMDWGGMAKMGVGLIGILSILTLFSKTVGSMKIKGGASLILLATSIGILVMSLMALKDLSADQMLQLGAGLLGILSILLLFTTYAGSMKGKGMGQLILVAGSIFILMQAIMPLANLKWEQLGKLGASLAGIMIILGAFINETQSMKATGMINLVVIAAAIWVLVRAIEPLAKYEWSQLAKIGVGLFVISGIVIAMTQLAGDMNILQGAGIAVMLVGFAAVLLAFGLAMSSVAGLKVDQIESTLSGFVSILITFALIQRYLLKDSDILDAVHTLILLGGLAVVMIAFSIALNEIKNVPTDKIIAFSIGLGVLVAGVGLALKLTKGLTIGGAIKSILIISAAVAALMAVFAIVGKFAIGTLASALTNLAANLKLFSGMMTDFSDRMNKVDEGSIKKAELIINMLAEMLSDLVGISIGSLSSSYLTNIASHLTLTSGMLIDFSSRMNRIDLTAFTKAQTMIDQIRLMMISLTGFEDFTSRREAFTTALFDLGTGIEIFATHTGNVGDMSNNSAIQIIKDLSGCAGDLDIIAKMDLDKLTSSMTGLGGAMMLYAKGAEEATGIATETEGAPDVAGAVRLLRDISNSLTEEGGFTIPENMPSDQALGTFGAQLAALAGALVEFEAAGSKLGSGTDKALECLDFFSDLKAKLSEINMGEAIGAVLTAFITKNDVTVQPNELETFGKNIEQLGLALAAFAKSTTIVDESTGEITPVDYSVAVEALQSFSGLANSLPTIGGINAWWTGNKESLTQLAADLEALGQGLKDFSMKVTGKSEDEYEGIAAETIEEGKTASTTIVDKAVEVFTKITEAQSKLQNVGGIASIWTGEPPSFTDIAAQFESLGQGLKDFSDKLNGVGESETKKFDPEAAKGALLVVDSMISTMTDIGTRLPKIGGIGNFFKTLGEGRTSTLSDVGTQIGGLGDGLSGFSTAISGKFGNADEIINALKVVSSVVDMIASMASTGEMISYGNVETYVDYINTFLTEMTSLERGVSGGPDRSQTVIQSLVTMMGDISAAMTAADNIDDKNLDIFATFVQSLNNLATINMETTLKSFEEVGNNISLGVQRGINSGSSAVIQAAIDMAVAAYEAAKAALDERSPSRLFMGIGAFASEGMALGITKSADQAANASESMANSTIDSARGVLANISSILASDVDAQPTITPVLDLTNVTAGAREISGMFGSTYGIGIDPSGARARASRTYSAPEAVAVDQNGIDSYGALARLDAMLENVQKMGESISNMKLVLDTGVIAGGVSDDVDIDIGRKMFYAARRN